MIPMSYITFISFDLIALLTGGLIQNFPEFIASFSGGARVFMMIVAAFLGVIIICLYPIHVALINDPGNWMFFLALILPWVITCFITSYLFSHSPRGGIDTSFGIGIGLFFFMFIPYLILSALLAPIGGSEIINSLSIGITGLPYITAVFFATMEGAAVGAFFGAFAGSLKYKGGGSSKKKKKKKEKESSVYAYEPEPILDTSSGPTTTTSGAKCPNCGANIIPGDDFCTDCGSKLI